jgi:hypothetical protein
MTDAKLQSQIEDFVIHLEEVETAFNAQSDACGLGVHLDVSDLIDQTRRGRNYPKILGFFGSERPGVLYREQIITAVDAIIEIIESPYNFGLILGALQSGKTTTALALQFAGPAVYLVTGQRVFPFYLTTSWRGAARNSIQAELATTFFRGAGNSSSGPTVSPSFSAASSRRMSMSASEKPVTSISSNPRFVSSSSCTAKRSRSCRASSANRLSARF